MVSPIILTVAAALRLQNPVPVDYVQIDCLARSIYAEARSEPLAAQIGVASAILNRGKPCVVAKNKRHVATAKRISEEKEWESAVQVAILVDTGAIQRYDASHFHDTSVHPKWTKGMEFLGRSGRMMFWRERV